MGIKDDFMGANLLVKIAAVVVLVAQLFNWISFCTTSWITKAYKSQSVLGPIIFDPNSKPSVAYVGLWRIAGNNAFTSSFLDGTASDAMAATQAFAIFGFVGLNVGCLLLVLFIFWSSCKGRSETGLGAGISLIVSAVTWLIAVIIIAADFNNSYYKVEFGFSFGLAICAFILAAGAGVLILVVQFKGGSVGAK